MNNPGIALGMAYRHDFNADISNYQREEALMRQRDADTAAQYQMLFESMPAMPDVAGEYDRNFLKQKHSGTLTKLGEIGKRYGPNWPSSLDAWKELSTTTNDFQNDEDTLRALSSTAHYKTMMDVLQKQPELASHPLMVQQKQMWEEYSRNGTLDHLGGPKGFSFTHPGKVMGIQEASYNVIKQMPRNKFGKTPSGLIGAQASEHDVALQAHNLVKDMGPAGLAFKSAYSDATSQLPEDEQPPSLAEFIYDTLQNQNQVFIDDNTQKLFESGAQKIDHYGNLFNTHVSLIGAEKADMLAGINQHNRDSYTYRGDLKIAAIPNAPGAGFNLQDENGNYNSKNLVNIDYNNLPSPEKVRTTGTVVRLKDSELGVEAENIYDITKDDRAARTIVGALVKAKLVTNEAWEWFNGPYTKSVDDLNNLMSNVPNVHFTTQRDSQGNEQTKMIVTNLISHGWTENVGLEMNQAYDGQKEGKRPSNMTSIQQNIVVGANIKIGGKQAKIVSVPEKSDHVEVEIDGQRFKVEKSKLGSGQ